MTNPVVGIDLGTTNSAIAAVVNGELTVIPVRGALTMPSAVGLDPAGRLIIGQAAKNQQISSPEATVLSIKRHMGTDYKATLGEKSYTPEEISALILGELKRAAEKHLGTPVTRAVVTVPAFFNEQQRKATQVAGELAGLEVLRIINEPTAAALAYGAGTSDRTARETLLVYDLGGGTFDVSLVTVEQGVVEVRASHGDTQLGGDDFDAALAARAEAEFMAQDGVPAALSGSARRRLQGVMENVKIRLSDEPFAPVAEEFLTETHHLRTEFARTDYEALIQPWLDKTLACLQRTLADAKVTAAQVDRIMLVGGATRTPLVQHLLASRLGKAPRHEINPDLIVAMGAAIQGASLAGLPAPAILIDITAHTYSIAVMSGPGPFDQLICSPIIPRGTALPVRRAEVYNTLQDAQPEVQVEVLQGEGHFPHENTSLGKFRITGLGPYPAGSLLVVEFNLDLNGLLTATAVEKATGHAKSITVDTRGQHRLNLDAARANLDALFAEADRDDDDDGDAFPADRILKLAADWDSPAGGTEAFTEPDPAGGAAPAGLLASAKSLRRRTEAVLTRGVAEKDALDLHQRLEKVTAALSERRWPDLQRETDTLSDLLFYLED